MAALNDPGPKQIVRLITCGSVDDGKSTLIGRLLYDAGAIPSDQIAALPDLDGAPDLSFLVDGLAAEREQGITIDVAYRFFDIGERRFVLADTPGHEQYTRNMVTAASTADLAIVLVDARKGVLTQTRRHSRLLALLGVRRVVLAVNKMDLVEGSQDRFEAIVDDYRAFADQIDLTDVTPIPTCALTGGNVSTADDLTPWYNGPGLMAHLRTVGLAENAPGPLRMTVQGVSRPNADFRGFAGRIVAGTARPGDAVRILPSGVSAAIDRIVTMDGDLDEAPT
ncbi:MAG: GTP-binding protein, partial [Brevundimonas sp.]|nr:GTP-binding protein [Brevundimonas sp.]